jgi:hypothetical protein
VEMEKDGAVSSLASSSRTLSRSRRHQPPDKKKM